MPVKHRVPEVLNDKCRHFFEARWPNESPLEINAYKLRVLTHLGQGTCLKLMSDEFYVPNERVMDCLCEVFQLQPGDFLYHEPSSSPSTEKPLFANSV
ncbi:MULTISPECIES: helix-turn-helix domain-containing protein [unclassified Microcoleus]|uniref:helix-turn-helix domain-containing protein n=1 Tax=unclassified Microcoleus TaxID=2642155 RepID=UPI00403EFBCF